MGYTLATGPVNSTTISFILRGLFDIYLLLLAILTLQDVEVPHHWVTVLHISSLVGLAFGASFISSLLPSTPDVQSQLFEETEASRVLVGLWYTNLALTLLAMMRAITIPRGPKLHFPSENIYSEKTLETSTTHDYANVCGISGEFFRPHSN